MRARTRSSPGRPACGAGLLAAAALLLAGCGDAPSAPGGQRVPAPLDRSWSPDEMSKDPEGYLAWADAKLNDQTQKREAFLTTLAERRAQVKERQQKAGADLTELENFAKRLATAMRRAEDEDRWPVVVGGASFDRSQAQARLDTLPKQIELRRPLAEAYEKALASMDAKATQLRAEIQALGRLREKLALDLEQVRLNQGAAELDKLGRTAAEIEHYAQILGEVTAESAAERPPTPREGSLLPLDSLLK